MNTTLAALTRKLQWQLAELQQRLHTVESEQLPLDQALIETEAQISQAYSMSKTILPEKEMARLSFLISKQELRDVLLASKSSAMQRKTKLLTQQRRLGLELQMLENYVEKQAKTAEQIGLVQQQNEMDEWVVLQRVRK